MMNLNLHDLRVVFLGLFAISVVSSDSKANAPNSGQSDSDRIQFVSLQTSARRGHFELDLILLVNGPQGREFPESMAGYSR